MFVAALFLIAPGEQMSFNGWMGKATTLLQSQKEWTVNTCSNIDEAKMHYTKWKKPNLKRLCTVCFYLYDILWYLYVYSILLYDILEETKR